MRRIRAILALACIGIAVGIGGPLVPSADAHICTNPAQVKVGQRQSINFGVASEQQPVSAVDVTVPNGFDLVEPVGFNGWQARRDGSVVHFTGPALQPYSCVFFTFDGTARRKGALFAEITVHNGDGTTRAYADHNPYSPFPALGIYADTPLPKQGVTPGESGTSSTPKLMLALSVAVIAGGVAALYLVNRSRRLPVR
jgi:hypothetical protein